MCACRLGHHAQASAVHTCMHKCTRAGQRARAREHKPEQNCAHRVVLPVLRCTGINAAPRGVMPVLGGGVLSSPVKCQGMHFLNRLMFIDFSGQELINYREFTHNNVRGMGPHMSQCDVRQ